MAQPPKINAGYELAITPPEEAAGAAYDAMKATLLEPLGIDFVELPMDMASRVKTDGKAVDDASRYVQENQNCIYVKGPGITPRDDQVVSTILNLEAAGELRFTNNDLQEKLEGIRTQFPPQKNAEAFAAEVVKIIKKIGSPNAKWRDVLEANLARGTADGLVERSLAKTPQWNAETPLTTYTREATAETRLSGNIGTDSASYRVQFLPEGKSTPVVIRDQKVSENTPLRLYTTRKDDFDNWVDGVLKDAQEKGAKVTHGMKQTVLKEFDGTMRGWMNEAIARNQMQGSIAPYAIDKENPGKLNNLLVDDLFSRLSTSELKEPLAILSPNPSYAAYVRDVWQKVAQNGGLKVPSHSQIVRASATGDHYKAVEYVASEKDGGDGVLQVVDDKGNIIMEKAMKSGDIAMVTHLDKQRTVDMIEQSLNNAMANGHKTVMFGFDRDDDYYKIARDAVENCRNKFPKLDIQLHDAAEATAKYLTGGVKDTVLVLNNIYGDFATDIEISGKGTSYSIGTMFDGRGVVELGSGGTAPDLLEKWKKTGVLEFNPMSFVEGIALALEAASKQMNRTGSQQTEATQKMSETILQAVYNTTDNGIVLPFIRGKFRKHDGVEYRDVSTQTFLQSVKVEAMKLLQLPNVQAEQEKLEDALALDKTLFDANRIYGDKWQHLNEIWNDKRAANGEINPFAPDYSLQLEEGMNPRTITAAELLKMQERRCEGQAYVKRFGIV